MILVLSLALAVAGLSTAPGSALRPDDLRVAQIAHRLATAPAAPCPRTGAQPGIALHHLAEYEVEARPEAADRYGLDRGSAIVAVAPDSPAARAGLRAGDVIIAIDERIPSTSQFARQTPEQARRPLERFESEIFQPFALGDVELDVLHDGVARRVTVAPAPGCAVRIRLARSGQINAFARRGYAIVTTGLLEFVADDHELAVAIGHEMAHVLLRHPDGAASRAQEAEADRLGLRLAWAGGYDIRRAKALWRRLARRAIIQLPIGHLVAAERNRIVDEVLEELRASQPSPEAPQLGKGALPQR